MVSQLHEALLLPFRNLPALVPQLLREPLCLELPMFSEASLLPADLNDIQPTEYRADLVLVLNDAAGVPVMGIVLEVQLAVDGQKKYAWPAYVANLYARLKCPVSLLVVAGDERVARWAAEPIEVGPGFTFKPLVLGPSDVPQITDSEEACAAPELAVLSALMHGQDEDTRTSVRIALATQTAITTLEADQSKLYYDLVMNALSEAAQEALKIMNPSTYKYQSEFARKYYSQGCASIVVKMLSHRYGALSSAVQQRVTAASESELETIAERLLTAASLEEALGSCHQDGSSSE